MLLATEATAYQKGDLVVMNRNSVTEVAGIEFPFRALQYTSG